MTVLKIKSLQKLLRDKKTLFTLLIFLIAFIPRLGMVLLSENSLTSDALGYDTLALEYKNKNTLFHITSESNANRVPIYPLFLATIYSLIGHNISGVKIFQAVLGALTCIFLFYIILDILGEKIALIGFLLAAFYVGFLKLTTYVLSENLCIFLLVTLAYWQLQLLKRPRIVYGILCGILIGLLTLTKALFIFYIMFFIAFFVIIKRDILRTGGAKTLIIATCSFLFVLAPWVFRNYLIYQDFVISTRGGTTFYSSYILPKSKFGTYTFDDTFMYAEQLGTLQRDSFLYKKTFEYIKEHPKEVLKIEIMKASFFWIPFDWEVLGEGKEAVYNYFYVFFMPFAIGGMLFCPKNHALKMVILPIIYIFLITLVFQPVPRFIVSRL